MKSKIEAFKNHVRQLAANPDFVHHAWFVKWHLEIVEKLAMELLIHYLEADADLVEIMVWLHDYGKILDFDNQYQMTLVAGREKLLKLGFSSAFVDRAISDIETLDKKMEIDLNQTAVEVKIIASADGCSHFVGPFMSVWWQENNHETYQDLMSDTLKKLRKDWDRKIVLLEARAAFQKHYDVILQQAGELPEHFLKSA